MLYSLGTSTIECMHGENEGQPRQKSIENHCAEMSSQLRRTLAAKSVSAIRKAKHNQKKKPYSEICHGMDQDTVNSLMVGFEPISATKQMTKWSLHGDDIYDLFPDSKLPRHVPSICASRIDEPCS